MRQEVMSFYSFTVFLFILLFILFPMSFLFAEENASKNNLLKQESQNFVIKGVYYLINQTALDAAGTECRK